MQKEYLKISEFAGLRGVSIGSLRYYEKLRILVPAKTDPKTGYRYYLPEQLATLDTILLCIALNIPLKDLKNYIDESGALDLKRILTSGKQAMQEKIGEMQKKLELIQFNLDSMERNEKLYQQRQVYTRTIGERFLFVEPIPDNWRDLPKTGENRPMKLFRQAQDENMDPVFPSGVLARNEEGRLRFYFYFQVLHPGTDNPHIIRIPEGAFSCLQTDLSRQTNFNALLDEYFPAQSRNMIIIANMMLSKTYFDSLHSEIQIIPD
ncbi:MAG: MerR family transcriptional regulator [Faecousia sp.]